MVNDQKIVVAGKGGQICVAKIMQASLLPSNLNFCVEFLKPLGRCNQRWECTAVVPGNAAEYGS